MLIEKTIEVNDIVTMKLITGEEIVSKVVALDTNTVTITKPMVLNIALDEKTRRPGIQMYPFFLLGANPESRIPLRREHIVALLQGSDDIKSGYVANTSGLDISPSAAASGLITP